MRVEAPEAVCGCLAWCARPELEPEPEYGCAPGLKYGLILGWVLGPSGCGAGSVLVGRVRLGGFGGRTGRVTAAPVVLLVLLVLLPPA